MVAETVHRRRGTDGATRSTGTTSHDRRETTA